MSRWNTRATGSAKPQPERRANPPFLGERVMMKYKNDGKKNSKREDNRYNDEARRARKLEPQRSRRTERQSLRHAYGF